MAIAMSSAESSSSLVSSSSFFTLSSEQPAEQWLGANIGCDSLDPIKTEAARKPLRGMESELVDLVFGGSTPDLWMGWLRLTLECAAASGSLDTAK